MAVALRSGRRAAGFALCCASLLWGCGKGDDSRQGPRPQPMGTAGTAGTAASGGSNGGASGTFGNPNALDASAIPPPPSRGDAGVCVNLQCQQMMCPGGGSTTISGTVYDPAGNNPLYNVVVYVPNEPVLAAQRRARRATTATRCTPAHPIAAALTDCGRQVHAGRTRRSAPTSRWSSRSASGAGSSRSRTSTACQDNPQPDGMLTLPRNRSEGDIPNIAISTGGADTLECLLRRIGVDASEYVPGAGGEGRIHIFQGSPTASRRRRRRRRQRIAPEHRRRPRRRASTALWNSVESLMAYDIVLLSCEGDETHGHEPAGAARLRQTPAAACSHRTSTTRGSTPDRTASENLATWTPGSNDIGDIDGHDRDHAAERHALPQGRRRCASGWSNVGALQNGTLADRARRATTPTSGPPTPPRSRGSSPDQNSRGAGRDAVLLVQHADRRARPSPTACYCGRVVYSDLHVGAASGDDPETAGARPSCADGELSAAGSGARVHAVRPVVVPHAG